jgi:selenocysteine lyase/cysteine desulfurase
MSGGIDVARARAETPGVRHRIHLNNCGAALMPAPVLEAVLGHLRLEAEIGGYEAAEQAAAVVENCHGAVARLLNCRPDEVAVVENATIGWDMAFYAMPFRPGDRILTAVSEYSSNYIAYLQVARKTGAEIVVVPDDASGQLDVAALARLIDERAKLISVTHVPTGGGLVNPAAAIGRLARAAGVPFLLDACQSAGQMPLDVEALGCDMLSATSRKFLRGPRGIGFLYVRREMLERLEPPFLDLHAARWVARDRYEPMPDARRFENWEKYVAGMIGLGVAIDYALGWGLEAIRGRVYALADEIRRRMLALPGGRVHDLGREKCGIVSFRLGDLDPFEVKRKAREAGINLNTSTVFSTRLAMEAHGLEAVNRLGVHYYNSEEEIDRLFEFFRGLIGPSARR